MIIEVKVPSPGESISEVQLAGWLVEDGEYVEKDQDIAEIDSDKATLSISAAESGMIRILKAKGENVGVGEVVATIDTDGKQAPARQKKEVIPAKPVQKIEIEGVTAQDKPPVAAEITEEKQEEAKLHLSPLAKKLLDANNLSQAEFIEYLKQVRFGKSDIEFFIKEKEKNKDHISDSPLVIPSKPSKDSRETERRQMSTLRLKLAERLVSVKNETAMLTTFNEVNMG